jgi:xanthomonalisin
MINEQSAANGGKPVGFLNPALYAIGTGSSFDSDFHDIISGSNGGYSAVAGYDLVTGWGSPQGVNLIKTLAPANEKAK